MKTVIIAICFFLFGITASRGQEALQIYTIEMSRIETLADETQKSDGRGKALAAFFDSRTAEAGKQTAINETVPYLRQLVDYDFYGAYNFLMKVKNLDDAQLFMKNHLSKDERALVRAFASNTVNNWQSGGQYPAKAPQKGYGLKGKWNAGTGASNNTAIVQNTTTPAQTDNGDAELNKAIAAYQAKSYIEAKIWYQKSADKGNKKAKDALLLMAQNENATNSKTIELKPFKNDNGKWGFKDGKNTIIVQPKYDETRPFSEGMAAVCITEDNTKKWGYIDQNGKEIVPLIYGDAIRFSEGLAAVRPVGKTWNSFYGFIDKSGKLIIPHQYEFVFDNAMYDGWVFVDGKAKVYKDKRIFYIDKNGKDLSQTVSASNSTAPTKQTQELKAFSDKPLNRFGKWGFKDQNGKVIVAPKYNSSHQFREGLAAVSIGGSYDEEFDRVLGSKYGFIDNTGKEVIALKYESINDGFYEGLAAVKLNGKWGYINTAGNEVIPFQYSEAFIFMNGKAKVRKDGREFFIDKTGKEVK